MQCTHVPTNDAQTNTIGLYQAASFTKRDYVEQHMLMGMDKK